MNNTEKSTLEMRFDIYPSSADGLYYYALRQSRDFPDECIELVYYEDKDGKWEEESYYTFGLDEAELLLKALQTLSQFMKDNANDTTRK